MQHEVGRDLEDYPSLEPAVQLDIARKYRVMHQKVHDMGYYNCHYVEYAKEIARYLTLFTLSMVTLRYEWYMISAAFLGLFWVCHHNTTPHVVITG